MLKIIFQDETEYSVGATQTIGKDLGSESTNYRVEVGANISDHIENAPIPLTFDCVFGDSPLNATGPGTAGRTGEHTEFDDKMNEAWANKDLITLDSFGRDIWENMQIQSYNVSANDTTGHSIVFTLTVKEIRFADSKTGRNIPDVAKDRPTARRFAPARAGGSVTPVPASEGQLAQALTI